MTHISSRTPTPTPTTYTTQHWRRAASKESWTAQCRRPVCRKPEAHLYINTSVRVTRPACACPIKHTHNLHPPASRKYMFLDTCPDTEQQSLTISTWGLQMPRQQTCGPTPWQGRSRPSDAAQIRPSHNAIVKTTRVQAHADQRATLLANLCDSSPPSTRTGMRKYYNNWG